MYTPLSSSHPMLSKTPRNCASRSDRSGGRSVTQKCVQFLGAASSWTMDSPPHCFANLHRHRGCPAASGAPTDPSLAQLSFHNPSRTPFITSVPAPGTYVTCSWNPPIGGHTKEHSRRSTGEELCLPSFWLSEMCIKVLTIQQSKS